MVGEINLSVVAFFFSGAAWFGYISIFYLRQKSSLFKLFGLGLLLNAVAFLFWLYMVTFRPVHLEIFVGIGVIFFFASFVSFFAATLSDLKKDTRLKLSIIGILFLSALVALRFLYAKSDPQFTSEGFFWFNADQLVVYAYVLAMSFSIIPAVYKVGNKIKNSVLRPIIEICFTQVVICSVILITSPDMHLQVINGWVLMAVLTVLGVTHTVSRLDLKK